ncbi:2 5-diketo-D-gluconic acid reductase [Fusarium mexicanum]|uniref:2 5-diketo-D-gluconic acid reductase n=1 Tax=Fusarium mexicanum TaxID=751941 RepID=A0A8H5MM27_9HYPO|nr:2 5-diketo-D-gluconic acid reductase [Fusarium mexicanum]
MKIIDNVLAARFESEAAPTRGQLFRQKRKVDDITADEATPAPGTEKPNSVASRRSDASGAAGPLLKLVHGDYGRIAAYKKGFPRQSARSPAQYSELVSSLDYLIQSENASVDKFEISEADVKELDGLDEHSFTEWDPTDAH